MPGIICAIRGGPHSQPTIQEAIQLAKETGIPIYFLYVVNMDFLQWTQHSRLQTVKQEMSEMGEFILLTAQVTAEREGVTAHGVVREGAVSEEIVRLGQEVKADYVILGRPQKHTRENVLHPESMDKFSQQIEEETGAKVVFPSEGNS